MTHEAMPVTEFYGLCYTMERQKSPISEASPNPSAHAKQFYHGCCVRLVRQVAVPPELHGCYMSQVDGTRCRPPPLLFPGCADGLGPSAGSLRVSLGNIHLCFSFSWGSQEAKFGLLRNNQDDFRPNAALQYNHEPIGAPLPTTLRKTSSDERWNLVLARDKAADGAFYYAVTTTGVYCQPNCASRTPHHHNATFYDNTEAAESAGYRPCKRRKPDQPAR